MLRTKLADQYNPLYFSRLARAGFLGMFPKSLGC
jgi:hypothetical protein